MSRKISKEELLNRFKEVHGDRYGYENMGYTRMCNPINILCPKHGYFTQIASVHAKGHGCNRCAREKQPQYGNRSNICGVGVFDADYSKTKDALTKKAYRDWNNMLQRCYGKSNFPSKPAYKECVVCEEWHSFLKFREWFDENYIEGYFLDKDILVKGNKTYSPQTCSYVPSFINTILLGCKSVRGDTPIGVSKHFNKFVSYIYKYGKQHYIGSFPTAEKAFDAYKKERELYIKQVSQEYYDAGKITKRVYDALMNYKVEITD